MSLFTPPVSAAQAGLLGSSPEDVPHSPGCWISLGPSCRVGEQGSMEGKLGGHGRGGAESLEH